MMSDEKELSVKDIKLLDRIKFTSVPHYRNLIAKFLLVLAAMLSLLHILAIIFGVANHPFRSTRFFLAIITFQAGAFQLQEVRYRKIIRHLLLKQPTPENAPA